MIQAVAAVGQGRLIRLYDDLFGQFHQPVAQILLTKNDLSEVISICQANGQPWLILSYLYYRGASI